MRTFRATKPAPGTPGVAIPGDPERLAEAERRVTGVPGGPATVLAAFSGGPGGYSPLAGVVADGSTLYGTTGFGGMGLSYGTVFSVPMSGGPITTLAQFNGTNGYEPQADMMLFGLTLYGTTTNGGIHGQGNIFSIPITGGAITNVASFSNLDPNNSTGAAPLGGLILNGSTFYGATTEGGPFPAGTLGDGVVYALTGVGVPEPSTWVLFAIGIAGLFARRLRHSRRTQFVS